MQPDTKTATEIYIQLGIAEPFKDWIAKQQGFELFESFYGKLPDGKLGKDYRLKPEQAVLLLPSVPTLAVKQKVLAKTGKNSQIPAAVKKKKKKLPPEIIIDGQVSVYWFSNNRGLPYDKISLDLLGRAAGARCNELGIVMGVKSQNEIRPDKTKWQGRVRT